jgi:putative redox protein
MKLAVLHESGPRFRAEFDGHAVTVDQPEEVGGSGEGMGPVALFMAAMGACIGTFVHMFAARRGIEDRGFRVDVEWEYADNPRRVASAKAKIRWPSEVPEKYRAAILKAAKQCVIHSTLKQTPELAVELADGGAG